MTDPITARPTVVIPGTPEGDAMVLESQMREEAAALHAGRGNVDSADRLLAEAGRLSMHVPASFHAELSSVAGELRRARDARANELPAATLPERPRTAPTRRQLTERRLVGAMRRLPEDPRAAAQSLSRAILGHSGRTASVRALGRMTPHDLDALMSRAHIAPERRAEVREQVEGVIGQAFHQEVVATADRAFSRGVRMLERASTSRPELDSLVSDLTNGPNTYAILNNLRYAGAESETRALKDLIERTHVDPSLRDELAGEIRNATAVALRAAARSLGAYHDETFGSGSLASDGTGFAYTMFPKAIPLAAQRLGVPAERAVSLEQGERAGDTLLERAAANQIEHAHEAQRNAKRVMVGIAIATSVAVSAMTGGLGAVLASASLEGVEVMGAWAEAESTTRAASVGMTTEHAVREAEVERAAVTAAAVVGLGAESAGLGHHASAVDEIALGVVAHGPAIGNVVRHESHH